MKLIKKLGEDDHIKIESKSFMPLTLEFLHNVQTGTEQGKLYSLSHTYVQNGDLMRDPEMCFIAVANPDGISTAIYPQMYQQDSLGLYEESVHINEGKVTGSIPVWQASHCAFANMWFKNILAQGFLK
ncbi:MAG TPA: hypothetical protein VK645_12660 [Chitinophagaceae bacterium]|nr:hypothetical protein [Chitinophagaceae bacterium]